MSICLISKVTVISVVQTEDSLYPLCTLQGLYSPCLLAKHCQLHGLLQAPIIPTESESSFKWGISQRHSHGAFQGCWSLLTKAFLKTVIEGSLWVLLGNSQVVSRSVAQNNFLSHIPKSLDFSPDIIQGSSGLSTLLNVDHYWAQVSVNQTS